MADTFDPAQFNVAGVSWTCAITAGSGSCGAASGTGNIATTVSLTSGSAATYTVTAPILASATGTLSNTATVAAPGGTDRPGRRQQHGDRQRHRAGCDVRPADHEDRRGDRRRSPGTSVTYTIVVTNLGPSDVADAPVADTFDPAQFNVAGVSWSCAITAGSGSCGAASGTGDLATTVSLTAGSARPTR